MTGIIGKISSRSKIVESLATVGQGGTGASTLTDGGVLLGSGTSAVTATAVLADGEMIVGDASGDPAIESGATLRTSIGVGTGDSPTFVSVNVTGGKLFNLASSVWALTGATTATGGDLTAWAECALNSYDGVGTLPTVSSGIFTFPYTGNWLITAHMRTINATNINYISTTFSLTENAASGSTYYPGMGSGQSVYGTGAYGAWSHVHMFEVTDLTNDKLKVTISNPWGQSLSGINTAVNMYSCLVFQLLSE